MLIDKTCSTCKFFEIALIPEGMGWCRGEIPGKKTAVYKTESCGFYVIKSKKSK